MNYFAIPGLININQIAKSTDPNRIFEAVCKYYNLDIDKTKSKSRKRPYVKARQIAQYLIAKKNPELTDSEIASLTGSLDRCTVIHSKKTIGSYIEVGDSFGKDALRISYML